MSNQYSTPISPSAPLSPSDERTWAMLAHLSILINLVSGILGPVAALIIYLVYKDRSRYVAYQSLQALIFQLVAWVGAGIIVGASWAIVGVLSAIIVGICLIPDLQRLSACFHWERWYMVFLRESSVHRVKTSGTGWLAIGFAVLIPVDPTP